MGEMAVLIGVFAATFAIGILLIVKIPPRLHTPLMSMTNAVSGITVAGAWLLLAEDLPGGYLALGLVAVAMGGFNLVGGFAITGRMLRFFKKKESPHG